MRESWMWFIVWQASTAVSLAAGLMHDWVGYGVAFAISLWCAMKSGRVSSREKWERRRIETQLEWVCSCGMYPGPHYHVPRRRVISRPLAQHLTARGKALRDVPV